MSHDPVERDPALRQALRDVAVDPLERQIDWSELSRTIGRRASPELARRRWRNRARRLAIPAALVASVLLLLQVLGTSQPASETHRGEAVAAAAGPVTVEELLETDVSDGQFRALLYGAAEAEDLLLIVAAEDLQ
jgi:hypothetical protein